MSPEVFSKEAVLCIIWGHAGGIRWLNKLGITMRKLALLAAIVLAATFTTKSDVFAAGAGEMANPNQNTIDLMRDAMTGGPVVQPGGAGGEEKGPQEKEITAVRTARISKSLHAKVLQTT